MFLRPKDEIPMEQKNHFEQYKLDFDVAIYNL
jgi:hypothetical protein